MLFRQHNTAQLSTVALAMNNLLLKIPRLRTADHLYTRTQRDFEFVQGYGAVTPASWPLTDWLCLVTSMHENLTRPGEPLHDQNFGAYFSTLDIH